ncbi:hypothetical protein [Halobaculum lipolyticum]|uniref:Uncharacterized protein n=1 Tax=Halobaculum lipolyticum TaxID=3032001 RepID=A0ABD5WG03_9EURY|nr:hypothetical protein [Halobaculum sp. DT31]
MHRRRVLAACSVALLPAAGCVAGPTDSADGATTTARSGPDTDTPTPTDSSASTPTPSSTPRTTTEECEWPTMCAGTTLLELFLDVDYERPVTLRLDCRSEPVTVDPGRYHEVIREEDGEECAVTVAADGETLYETTVSGSEHVTVRIDHTGAVDVETAVL